VKTYSVQRFQPTHAATWNAFIGQAKNATFLFHREVLSIPISPIMSNEQVDRVIAVLNGYN
jgi:dTDP-4-amino-4,6-dideoxygalactose transaminase